MKKFLVLFVSLLVLGGCISSNTKIKVMDIKSGNSVTLSEDGMALDIKSIEKDGVVIEVQDDKK